MLGCYRHIGLVVSPSTSKYVAVVGETVFLGQEIADAACLI